MHVAEAASRLFRAYSRFCKDPDPDALFNTLSAMHSLNDRLKRATHDDFHKFEQFLALKVLRNLTHHVEEVRANVRLLPMPGFSDLAVLCIVRRDQVERAIVGVNEKWQGTTRAACERMLHWYGPAVNINPCLFNFMVRAYEMLEKENLTPGDDSIEAFRESYQFEEVNGHSHFVDGRIHARATDIASILSAVVEQMPAP